MMLGFSHKSQGFTLIELMVILVIMGVLLSLVGPLAVNNLDKVTVKTEEKQLQNWLIKTSFSAFNRGTPLSVNLQGHQVVVYAATPLELEGNSADTDPIDLITFETLFFQPQTLLLNKNGFPSADTVEYQLTDKQFSINVQKMMQR
ncbi:prepilin-type N-terminal cleavage/methylation domain-containing protein [uncultured Shewanella sp.]|uniref:pilus assembly FimT family protein n=1 Tax=uncultured Shewanella sp. TaxID=173975 RepID=UPI00260B585D|nr:prepilin-type N-terminal cleavage/methylation domain-containing protein [uncultured Shewanella sp.]